MNVIKRIKVPAFIIALSMATVVLFVYLFEFQISNDNLSNNVSLEYKASDAHKKLAESTQTQVDIGIFPLEVYDIDFQRNTYKMSAYIWLKWDSTYEFDHKEVLSPPKTLEIMNLVDSWDFTQTEVVSDTLENGKSYSVMKIEGTFFQNFDLSRYPLDRQSLTIIFEDNQWIASEFVYVPDLVDTRLQDGIRIPGWKINGLTYSADAHTYGSKFGYEDDAESYAYSQITFGISIERPIQYFALKFVFPLTIIIIFSLIALWIPLNQFEVRIALSGSSLLNLVFLQQLYSDKIITSQQLVLIDVLYIWAYISIILTLAELIYSHNQYVNKYSEQEILQRNRLYFLFHILVFVFLVIYAVFSSLT
ncbi:MAG: hypothetical protein ACK5S9_07775 [Roseiflexaceae bacterium]